MTLAHSAAFKDRFLRKLFEYRSWLKWTVGFVVIEMNVIEWREEIKEELI